MPRLNPLYPSVNEEIQLSAGLDRSRVAVARLTTAQIVLSLRVCGLCEVWFKYDVDAKPRYEVGSEE